ncbi:unnamed protein product [Coregonus sp. 'balchen']|nr:unnamed protein product [Coregonus sp. 'balchen']
MGHGAVPRAFRGCSGCTLGGARELRILTEYYSRLHTDVAFACFNVSWEEMVFGRQCHVFLTGLILDSIRLEDSKDCTTGQAKAEDFVSELLRVVCSERREKSREQQLLQWVEDKTTVFPTPQHSKIHYPTDYRPTVFPTPQHSKIHYPTDYRPTVFPTPQHSKIHYPTDYRPTVFPTPQHSKIHYPTDYRPTVFPTPQHSKIHYPTDYRPTVFPTPQHSMIHYPTDYRPTVFPTPQHQPTVFPTPQHSKTHYPTDYRPTVFPTPQHSKITLPYRLQAHSVPPHLKHNYRPHSVPHNLSTVKIHYPTDYRPTVFPTPQHSKIHYLQTTGPQCSPHLSHSKIHYPTDYRPTVFPTPQHSKIHYPTDYRPTVFPTPQHSKIHYPTDYRPTVFPTPQHSKTGSLTYTHLRIPVKSNTLLLDTKQSIFIKCVNLLG